MSEFEAFANEVVGPMRASNLRKKTIREELLNHLNEAADGAREQGVAPEDLTSHVLKRFGDVETVRSEIEASIPVWQRVFQIRMLDRRDGESDYRYAARHGTYASTLIAGFMIFSIVGVWAKKGFVPVEMLRLLAWPVGAFVFVLGTFVLGMGIRRNVQQGNWRKALVQAFLNGAAFGSVPVVTGLAAEAVAPGTPFGLSAGAVVGVGLSAFVVPFSLGEAYWATRNCPWIEDLGRDLF